MVLRLNETETNPNPFINFITALPMPDPQDHEDARQLLRALAAQVRPVMKNHGFQVNSLEEYEYNAVFAGRNWNQGETIELVLRRADGSYCPTSWLMGTLCHELAHIKHGNHGPAFQALWARLRREVRQLQDRGYYGDGYWSSGTRLANSVRVSGDGIETGDFPEYMCGGAQAQARPSSLRRRRQTTSRRRELAPSLHTGRQTAKRRKAGGRVTSRFAFVGEGNSLADNAESSKGKRARSNRAREERALAAERRLHPHPAQSKDIPLDDKKVAGESSESESEVEFVQETDIERRKTLLNSESISGKDDKQGLGKGLRWRDFENEFTFSSTPKPEENSPAEEPRTGTSKLFHSSSPTFIELTDRSNKGDDDQCDIPTVSGSTFITDTKQKQKEKQKREAHLPFNQKPVGNRPDQMTFGKLVQSEIEFRKKEALGLGPPNGGKVRTLGGTPKVNTARGLQQKEVGPNTHRTDQTTTSAPLISPSGDHWNCLGKSVRPLGLFSLRYTSG